MAEGLKDLGIHEGKHYFHDLRPEIKDEEGNKLTNPTYKQIVWKIPDIRESVRAEKGHKICSSDYSQIEVKLMAFLSGDRNLIEAINSGKDIHGFNAAKVFGLRMGFDYETMNKARKDESHPRHNELTKIRSRIKTVTFGTPYGAGPKRVALMTGMNEDEAAEFIDEFFKGFPQLKAWLDKVGREAITYGFTTSPLGRKRFYPMPAPDDPKREEVLAQIRRWAGNHPIQAGNVDMLKPAMWGIYQRLRKEKIDPKDARILFVVHDEIVMTAREDLVPLVKSIMEEEMEKSYRAIIGDAIVNKIDVAIDDTWKKA